MGAKRPRALGANPASTTSRFPSGPRAYAFIISPNNATKRLDWMTVENDPSGASHAEYKKQAWGPVRVVNCWPLFLVEQGWAICLCTRPPRVMVTSWLRIGHSISILDSATA
jgi:hypothetical protein